MSGNKHSRLCRCRWLRLLVVLSFLLLGFWFLHARRRQVSQTVLSKACGNGFYTRVTETRSGESVPNTLLKGLAKMSWQPQDEVVERVYLSDCNGKNEWLIHSLTDRLPKGMGNGLRVHDVACNGNYAIVTWATFQNRHLVDIIRLDVAGQRAQLLLPDSETDFGDFQVNLHIAPDLSSVETDHSGMLDRPTNRYTFRIVGDNVRWNKQVLDVDPFDWKGSVK